MKWKMILAMVLAGPGWVIHSATAGEIPRDDLVVELLMSGDARDSSGNDHHGQIEGATPAIDRHGQQGMAYHFDGDDWISLSPPPTISDQALTISIWARYDDGPHDWWNNCMVAQDNGGGQNGRRIIQLSTAGRSITWHRMGENDLMSPVPLHTERWYHIVASFDGKRHRLYIDGLLQDTRFGSMGQHDEEPLYIGRKGSDEPDFTFRGRLDDVRIYNRALSGEQVIQLYQENPACCK
ncbi:MAG: LamG domain-containing protein [Gemmatimonadetes bacterium]|jgi:hypothetical protein|nr:LamG domain-containing protein [Gemmatimonadota bacterium]MBT6146524.1 LamG domain-containing protein [Gemmatimonadota bacterium]MBT7863012.1 LamG domain-containing protein [Gemmatimonadota bacterium]